MMKTGLVSAQGTKNLHFQPDNQLQEVHQVKIPARGLFGTGLVFLPQFPYEAVLCKEVLTKFIRQEGLELIEYQDVKTGPTLGTDSTDSVEPSISQVFIKAEMDPQVFEKKLAEVCQKAEHQIHESKLIHRNSFSLSNLSSMVIL
jgi:glutamate synthase (NADPH/NADH) large chain